MSTWTALLQDRCALSHAAAAGSRKWDDRLAAEIIRLQKALNDARCFIPPDRKTDKYDIITLHITDRFSDGRTALRILHLDRTAALFIRPVQIGRCIRLYRNDLKEISVDRLCQRSGQLSGHTAG